MTVILNLKKGIDLPIYQWLKFLPVTSAAGASSVSDDRGTDRYIYHLLGAAQFWRYDTWTDSWQQLASPPTVSFAAGVAMCFDPSRGTAGYIWLSTALTSSPWHMFAYFDIASNTWTSRAAVSGLGAAWAADAGLIHTCSTYNVAGNDDYIYLVGNNSTTWYRYSVTGNAWSSMSPVLPATAGAGCAIIWPFGYNTDRLYYFRGATTASLYSFTISSPAFSSDIAYLPKTETFATGTCHAYDTLNRIYLVKDATHRVYYYQLDEDKMYPGGLIPYSSTTAIVGDGMSFVKTEDAAQFLYFRRHSGQEYWRWLIGWY
jgi:hypothetical protein